MQEQGRAKSEHGLSAHGIRNANTIWWNLSTPALYEQAVQRHEGLGGPPGTPGWSGPDNTRAALPRTGTSSGSPPPRTSLVGEDEPAFDPEAYEVLRARLTAYLQGRDLYVQDCYAGADPDHRMPIRVVNETAWHNLFARNMFIQEHDPEKLEAHVPEYTILHAPGFTASPEEDGTNSEAFVLLHLGPKEVIIGGTAYAGEIKKSMFSIMNFLLPQKGVLPMHCSANYGEDRGRRRPLLRALRNRKDHPLRRFQPHAHRGRRARLERQRRLQLRGRVLREGDPPLPRGRAGDLRDHPALRDHSRERGHGQPAAPPGPGLVRIHGEHPGVLSHLPHPQRNPGAPGRASEERDLPHR